MMKFRFLLILWVYASTLVLGATTPSTKDYYTISTSEGLLSNTVGAFKKDSLGFIWIGTSAGLCRFDGCDLKSYPVLSGKDIWSIEELDGDTLLIGSLTGLSYFSRKSNNVIELDIPSTIVKDIQNVDGQRFLAGTETGLYLVSDQTPRRILLESGFTRSNHITSILREDNDIYWFSTEDGLGRIDLRTMESSIYRMEEGLTNTNFFICLTRIDNQIYLGSFNKGIFRFDMSDKTFEKVKGFEYNLIMTIDGQGDQLFVGTNGQGLKVMSLTDGHIETMTHKEKSRTSISSNTITAFLYDNNIQWVGTQFGGVSYTPVSEKKFSYYSQNDFYSTDYRVRCFYLFPNGDKLIGTRTGLFHVQEKTGMVRSYNTVKPSSHLRSDIIVYINRIQDKVLIGTYGGGVYVFDEKTLTLKDFSQEEFFLYGCIFHFVQDRKGDLWFASQSGLYHSTADGHILKKYDMINSSLPSIGIYSLCLDAMNRLWIGTKFGLALLDIDRGTLHTDCFNKPINSEVKYIIEDSRKEMWVCTDEGLYKISSNLVVNKHYTKEDLLPSNRVYSIQENKEGAFWIATQKEIVYFNPAENIHYTYRRQDGLSDLDFNNNVWMSNDSTIWWSSESGLIYASSKYTNAERLFTSKPTITSYSVSDTAYDIPYMDQPKGIVLPSSENNICFQFSNMDYALPYANLYEYKLEGYDKEWIRQTGINEVIYTNLPGGHYIFKLRDPGSEQQVQAIDLHVKRSYAFLACVLSAILIIGLLIIYYGNRIWQLKKRIANERKIFSSVQEHHDKGKTLTIPDAKVNRILDNLLSYMEEEKPYLNAKLTISDVTAKLGCTDSTLSQLLNKHMDVNFANFINIYRVNEIKNRLTQENLSKYTLMALSEQCGLNSKTTFYRVFKNVTGMTPLEYCNSQGLVVKKTN